VAGDEGGASLAKQALARAREVAAANRLAGERSAAAQRRSQVRSANAADSRRRVAETRAEGDPVAFGASISDLLADRGWEGELSQARVTADWPAMVGPEIAAHSEPVSLRGGVLTVEASSTSWATEITLLQRKVLASIALAVGPDVVTKLVVRGPVGPSWRHGRLRVPGQGPRDTYG